MPSPTETLQRRRAAAVVLLACAVLLVPAAAHARTSVVIEGRCAQVGAFVPVPIGNVRDRVPERFAIPGEEAGVAVVLVTVGHCEPYFVDGRPARPMTFGLVCVVGAYPRDRDEDVASLCYDLWWSFNHGDMTARWRSLGIASETVHGISLDVERGPAGGLTSAHASVPSGRSPFSLTAVAGGVPPADIGAGEGYHWHEGSKGLVGGLHTQKEWHSPVEEQFRYNLTGGNETEAALVTIDTPDGSPLAHILGASTVTLPGASMEFPAFAVTSLVEEAGPEQPGERARAVRHDGPDCEQAGAFVPVPADNVRDLVPGEFDIAGDAGGQAVVLVTGGRCERWSIDDLPAASMTFGLVGVMIDTPDGHEPGLHVYDLWWFFDHEPTHAGFTRLGVFSRRLPEIGFEVEHGAAGAARSARVSVPWKQSPFTVEVTAVATPAPPDGEGPSFHWHVGRHGTVLGEHENLYPAGSTLSLTAAGVVRATPDSPLAAILGGDTATGAGLYQIWHTRGVTGLLPLTRPGAKGA